MADKSMTREGYQDQTRSGAVAPIPPHMHALTPHLNCRRAAEAIAFYKLAFGAEELGRMTGPDGQTIIHAMLKIGDSPLMLADENADWGVLGPETLGGSPVTVHLYVEDVDATVAKAVAAGAEVTMPVEDMFWGDRYGKLKDPFGHHWSVATRIANPSQEEMEAKMLAMMTAGEG